MSISPIRKGRSEKPNLARIAREIAVAMAALIIVVGAAVFLPVALSRPHAIVVTAVLAFALVAGLAAAGSATTPRNDPHNHVHPPLSAH